jgi:hypothetical protein
MHQVIKPVCRFVMKEIMQMITVPYPESGLVLRLKAED